MGENIAIVVIIIGIVFMIIAAHYLFALAWQRMIINMAVQHHRGRAADADATAAPAPAPAPAPPAADGGEAAVPAAPAA